MRIRFTPIQKISGYEELLYVLLKERPSFMNISHRKLPTMAEHRKFVRSKPYKEWSWILADDQIIGSAYLSRINEIGFFLFKKCRGKGLEKKSLESFVRSRRNSRLLANVSLKNKTYARLFRSLGFKHIQETYCLQAKGRGR